MIKKHIFMIAIIFMTFITLSTKVMADGFAFTKQPIGGTTEHNKDFIITWETNNNSCQYMLQMRDGAGYDWGNADYVTSPHKENYSFDFKSDYRIMAMCGDDTYYSNPITISWVKPNNITTASLKDIEIGDLPLGYNNSKTYPVSITNTGTYEIISPKLVFGEGYDYCEIIQNKTPHNIKPGETDNTTWSIKPKKGLGIGRYDTYVYLKSENIPAGTSFAVLFWVIESDVKITYSASASSIDFGTLNKGYSKQEDKNFVVKATGTGNLSHVHIARGESNNTFFDIQTNSPTIDTLSAGTDTGKNWSIKLRSGLEPGSYSEQIKVYADELKNPVIATIKVKINDNQPTPVTPPKSNNDTPVSNKNEENIIPKENKEEIIPVEENKEEGVDEVEEENNKEENIVVNEDVKTSEVKKSKESNIGLFAGISAGAIAIVGITAYLIIKNRKSKDIVK